ncbi:MAG: 16S rRNA (guanine(527)-N(7))-methyltransferase RsmG [Chloroflexi bacterium]|nr:16S rRNA (guanine(527)-N(7))-methyltransferase RsmG [Chloroflexota bacterium]
MEKLVQDAEKLGLALSAEQVRQFQLYYEELVEWNKRINLTAITDYDEVQVKHFLDSLTLVSALQDMPWAKGEFALLDVGTGAGMPGIPMKLILPRIRLVLLDSVAKKTAFLKHIVGKLGLEHVEVVTGRAEEVAHQPDYREKFELVVSRALSRLSTTAELTLAFCRQGGFFIAQKKGAIEEELRQAALAIDILGGRVKDVRMVDLELLGGRSLVIVEKVSPTPDRYPRRTGVPAKRPL